MKDGLFDQPDDATPLTEEEKQGLIPDERDTSRPYALLTKAITNHLWLFVRAGAKSPDRSKNGGNL